MPGSFRPIRVREGDQFFTHADPRLRARVLAAVREYDPTLPPEQVSAVVDSALSGLLDPAASGHARRIVRNATELDLTRGLLGALESLARKRA